MAQKLGLTSASVLCSMSARPACEALRSAREQLQSSALADSKAGSHALERPAPWSCWQATCASTCTSAVCVSRRQQTDKHIDAAEPLYDERRDIINGTKEAPEQPDIRDDEPGLQPERGQLYGVSLGFYERRLSAPEAGLRPNSSDLLLPRCTCAATLFSG